MSNTDDYINDDTVVYCEKIKLPVNVRALGFLEIIGILESRIIDLYHVSIKRYVEDLSSPEAEVQYIINAQRNEPKEDELYRLALVSATTPEGQQEILFRGLELCNPELEMSAKELTEKISDPNLVKIQTVLFKLLAELAAATADDDEETDDEGAEDDNGKKDEPDPEAKPATVTS